MIARISGLVVEIEDFFVVVDTGGVGYLVAVPTPLAERLELGDEVTLRVHTVVKDGAIELFGFEDSRQRGAFELLISVNGVGPKTARTALSQLTVQELALAIAQEDIRALTRVTGLGKKSAQRIVLDLAGKLTPEFVPVGVGKVAKAAPPKPKDQLPLALAQLGYKRTEIDKAMASLSAQGKGEAPLDERIRLSLKHLSGG